MSVLLELLPEKGKIILKTIEIKEKMVYNIDVYIRFGFIYLSEMEG